MNATNIFLAVIADQLTQIKWLLLLPALVICIEKIWSMIQLKDAAPFREAGQFLAGVLSKAFSGDQNAAADIRKKEDGKVNAGGAPGQAGQK